MNTSRKYLATPTILADEYVSFELFNTSYHADTLKATNAVNRNSAYAAIIYFDGKMYSVHADTPLDLKHGRDAIMTYLKNGNNIPLHLFRHSGGIGTASSYFIL